MRRHKSAAQPVQLARQAADTARTAAGSARTAADSIDVAELRDNLASNASRAAVAAREAAANVDLADVRDSVVDEVNKDLEFVIDETRANPVRSLLIAVGAGFVIGAVVTKVRNRKQPQPTYPG